MRITARDLDPALLAKINQFDTALVNFDPKSHAGKVPFLVLNDNAQYNLQYFYTHLMNQTLSNDDIMKLEERINNYVPDRCIQTQLSTDINIDNIACKNFPTLGTHIKQIAELKINSKIKKVKYHGTNSLVITDNGNIFDIDLSINKTIFSLNVINEIKRRLSITDISAHDILDVILYKDGLLVSTTVYGIIYLSVYDVDCEIIATENDVIDMIIYGEDNLMCTVNRVANNIVIYNITTKQRIEVINELKRSGDQMPRRIKRIGKYVFVLGRNSHKKDSNKILHCWILNADENQLSNVSSRIQHPFVNDMRFHPSFIESCGKYLYLIGFRGPELIAYKYDTDKIFEEPEKHKISLNGIDIRDAASIHLFEDTIMLGFANRIIEVSLKTNHRIRTMLLTMEDARYLNIINNKIIFILHESIFEYTNPEFKFIPTFSIRVLDDIKPCNNIDIFVKGNFSKPKISLIDENAKYIQPEIIIKRDSGIFIKLINCKSNKIILMTTIQEEDKVDGVAIHCNQIYYTTDEVLLNEQ